MLQKFHEAVGSSLVSWPALGSALLLIVGVVLEAVGHSELAGIAGLYGIVLLLLALVSYGSLKLLKMTSPLFMGYHK
ncbi:hypothetical protein [Natrarchaeobius chitinivorans]|uniref:Uncharacterized protein n=1 Tax=Natrarchaeobius chitinivorans TaxID=1679083 RepID=A0A3N6LTV5_NATCH|nr:hypothetical protein [Natrarchaeobius chitinivorans]RQG93618.1 hypothetical protein EA473_14940 [Natrarchaeobius chitinivorans]